MGLASGKSLRVLGAVCGFSVNQTLDFRQQVLYVVAARVSLQWPLPVPLRGRRAYGPTRSTHPVVTSKADGVLGVAKRR